MNVSDFVKELRNLISARYPVIYIVSYEENFVVSGLNKLCQSTNKNFYIWSVTEGFHKIDAKDDPKSSDPLNALKKIDELDEKALIVLKDLHPYMGDENEQYLVEPIKVRRKLRDIILKLKSTFKTLILLSPILKIPEVLEKDIVVMDFPLPDVPEIENLIENKIAVIEKSHNLKLALNLTLKERFAKAALGLTRREVENVLNKAIVGDAKLNEDDLDLIIHEKKQILRKTGLLEYFDVNESFSNVGGLNNLKDWLEKRGKAFSEEAKAFGLPEPKGILLLGVQGCGKSLISKAISALWKLPMLRFDLGNIFGSYIGQSEENMRKALKIAEALSPTILWIDEIEKGFAGAGGSGGSDSGVTKRIFGTFITWMQEKTNPVFIIATANSIENLPPELLRKGRFDEIFFVDLPTRNEIETIFKIHISKRNRDPKQFDMNTLCELANGFSGAEIEQAVISALYDVYYDGKRELKTEDLAKSLNETVPLSVTMGEKIGHLREWASTRARNAT